MNGGVMCYILAWEKVDLKAESAATGVLSHFIWMIIASTVLTSCLYLLLSI